MAVLRVHRLGGDEMLELRDAVQDLLTAIDSAGPNDHMRILDLYSKLDKPVLDYVKSHLNSPSSPELALTRIPPYLTPVVEAAVL